MVQTILNAKLDSALDVPAVSGESCSLMGARHYLVRTIV
jgi:hypothetical protein